LIPKRGWRAPAVGALLLAAAAGALAQPAPSSGSRALPRYGEGAFEGVYPVRVLKIETARMLDGGDGIVGFGDTRYSIVDHRIEVHTHTITDLVGIANLGVKVGVREPDGLSPGIAIGLKYYQSYPGLLNEGVRRIAESFSSITDAEVDVSGYVAFATASWIPGDGATGYHLGVQAHIPSETQFEVRDDNRGGGGIIDFEEGDDVSVMWGVDHQLIGTKLLGLAEAGWSFGLERARFGLGVDTGSQRWRFVGGVTWPGVETDVATEPRDFFVNPVLSIHYRF
jgi:hypothetical protein